jgi:hypothetical protein
MNTTPGASMKAPIIGAETAGWSGRRTGKGRLNGGLLSAELGRCGRDFISDAASTHPIVAGLSPRPVALGLSRHWRGLRLRALGSPEWHMCRGRGVYTGSEQEPVPGPGRISRAMDRPAGGRGRDWMAIAVLSVVATDFYRPKTVVVQLRKSGTIPSSLTKPSPCNVISLPPRISANVLGAILTQCGDWSLTPRHRGAAFNCFTAVASFRQKECQNERVRYPKTPHPTIAAN